MPTVSVKHLVENAIMTDCDKDQSEHNRQLVWFCKMSELSPEFMASIRENGIQVPIGYMPSLDRLGNGHHRVIAAYLLGIQEIEYVDDFWDAFEFADTAEDERGLPRSCYFRYDDTSSTA